MKPKGLVISRKEGECFLIGPDIVIEIDGIHNPARGVSVRVIAPADLRIERLDARIPERILQMLGRVE